MTQPSRGKKKNETSYAPLVFVAIWWLFWCKVGLHWYAALAVEHQAANFWGCCHAEYGDPSNASQAVFWALWPFIGLILTAFLFATAEGAPNE